MAESQNKNTAKTNNFLHELGDIEDNPQAYLRMRQWIFESGSEGVWHKNWGFQAFGDTLGVRWSPGTFCMSPVLLKRSRMDSDH